MCLINLDFNNVCPEKPSAIVRYELIVPEYILPASTLNIHVAVYIFLPIMVFFSLNRPKCSYRILFKSVHYRKQLVIRSSSLKILTFIMSTESLLSQNVRARQAVVKISRDELEDRYLRLQEEILLLKQHTHKQEDKIKRCFVKFITQLVTDCKSSLIQNLIIN